MPRAPFHLDSIKAVLAANGEMRQGALATACDLSVGTLIAAVRPGLREGVLADRREGRSVWYRLADGVTVEPSTQEEDGVPEFNAALWADGDLVLLGVSLNEDGHSVTLGPDKVRTLCRLLHGQGPEE